MGRHRLSGDGRDDAGELVVRNVLGLRLRRPAPFHNEGLFRPGPKHHRAHRTCRRHDVHIQWGILLTNPEGLTEEPWQLFLFLARFRRWHCSCWV